MHPLHDSYGRTHAKRSSGRQVPSCDFVVVSKLSRFACVILLLAAGHRISAQGGYFGRNKVQYRDFKFQVLKTEHFDIYFYPEEEAAARMASRHGRALVRAALDAARTTSCAAASRSSSTPAGRTSGRRTSIEGELGEGTGGVTEAVKRRIVLPFAGPIESTDHVLGHELVHAFQYDITNTNVSSGNGGALVAAAVVHRGHGRIPVDRPGRSAHRDVDARGGAAREAAGHRRSRRPAATSPIATARRSGRSSAASTATR